MAYSDLSVFLPRAEGDKLNVEQARAEAGKRADYLSSMDQFYESLEETQRQFDIQQELSERQFEWESGFMEEKLEAETGLAEERLALEEFLGKEGIRLQEAGLASEERYRSELFGLEREKLEMQGEEQDFLQWLHGEKLGMDRERLDLDFAMFEESRDPIMQPQGGFSPPFARRPDPISPRRRQNYYNPKGEGYTGYSNPYLTSQGFKTRN